MTWIFKLVPHGDPMKTTTGAKITPGELTVELKEIIGFLNDTKSKEYVGIIMSNGQIYKVFKDSNWDKFKSVLDAQR